MMRPCVCSLKAFESFVQDFAGIAIRTTPQRAHLQPQHPQRYFGANTRIRGVETTQTAQLHDSLALVKRQTEPLHHESGASDESDPTQDYGYRGVEVEPISNEIQVWDSAASNEGIGGMNESSIDQEHVQREAAETSTQISERQLRAGGEASTTPERSRAQNRLARKVRRVQAGTFRLAAERRAAEEDEGKEQMQGEDTAHTAEEPNAELDGARIDRRMKTALSTIQSMEGPDIELPETQEEHSVNVRARQPHAEGGSYYRSVDYASANRKAMKPSSAPDARTATSGSAWRAIESESKEPWQSQKAALKRKFGDVGWQPRKRLSPDTLDGIRALHESDPIAYHTEVLAEHFRVSPEAIRRILRAKWRPNEDEVDDRRLRWEKRGEKKWTAMAEQGARPPAKWRAKGIRTPQAEQKRSQGKQADRFVEWQDDLGDSSKRQSLSARIL